VGEGFEGGAERDLEVYLLRTSSDLSRKHCAGLTTRMERLISRRKHNPGANYRFGSFQLECGPQSGLDQQQRTSHYC